MFDKKLNILIIYGWVSEPMRATIRDLLFCYHNYTNHNCFFLDISKEGFRFYLLKVNFDIIIYHTVLLSAIRWGTQDLFDSVLQKIRPLKNNKAIKVALPQDEWIHTNLLNRFINEMNINIVFSVAPESEWHIIYEDVDRDKVQIYQVLTGYLDTKVLKAIQEYEQDDAQRDIDIGYRAYKAPMWLGRHGYLKTYIADVFQEYATQFGFKTDISTKEGDTILGNNWYKYLLRCKYFIGVEGGSTVHDPDGKIWANGTLFSKENPNATFEDVEASIFPHQDGNLKLIAISPRHLECCATKTCQVLIEGNYNSILEAHKHYIELKKNFSNLTEVLEMMKDENLRIKIAEQAYQDIVISDKYSYKTFVDFVVVKSISASEYSISTTSLISKLVTLYWHLLPVAYRRRFDRVIYAIESFLLKLTYKTGLKKELIR